MNDVTKWVVEAANSLGLAARVRQVLEPERSQLLARVMEKFLERPHVRFWWEHLSTPSESWHTEHGYRHVSQVAPTPDTPAWLITDLERDDKDKGVFECTPTDAVDLIAECPGFEYAVVDRGLLWIIMENHHEILIATGAAGEALARLREEHRRDA